MIGHIIAENRRREQARRREQENRKRAIEKVKEAAGEFCPDLSTTGDFTSAFSEARAMRVPKFKWCGKVYHTRTAEEEQGKRVYVIGSLRNPRIPKVGAYLREALDCPVFDDWYAAGPEADDYWKEYEQARGRTYAEALQGYAAKNVFAFDRKHLEEATHVVLTLPAGKSGHLEFGWSLGKGKKGHVLLEPDVDRWDVMYQFADGVHNSFEELVEALK